MLLPRPMTGVYDQVKAKKNECSAGRFSIDRLHANHTNDPAAYRQGTQFQNSDQCYHRLCRGPDKTGWERPFWSWSRAWRRHSCWYSAWWSIPPGARRVVDRKIVLNSAQINRKFGVRQRIFLCRTSVLYGIMQEEKDETAGGKHELSHCI